MSSSIILSYSSLEIGVILMSSKRKEPVHSDNAIINLPERLFSVGIIFFTNCQGVVPSNSAMFWFLPLNSKTITALFQLFSPFSMASVFTQAEISKATVFLGILNSWSMPFQLGEVYSYMFPPFSPVLLM